MANTFWKHPIQCERSNVVLMAHMYTSSVPGPFHGIRFVADRTFRVLFLSQKLFLGIF